MPAAGAEAAPGHRCRAAAGRRARAVRRGPGDARRGGRVHRGRRRGPFSGNGFHTGDGGRILRCRRGRHPHAGPRAGGRASLYVWLERHRNLRVSAGHEAIEAGVADADLAAELQISVGGPVLVARRTARDHRSAPVEYAIR
ncbi:UTRA domain-containing protein, partial [Mycobacterium sp. NAZ190054]|uniref:UTRA domain-containing protein n=1 Tax=Mycobacterium sp. NAZ190054 TaxID=1747766 RepID=UPI00351011EA